MKKLTLLAFATLTLLTGCGIFGKSPSPPSAFEEHLFDVRTNYVPQVMIKTNFVDVPITVYVIRTNELNQVTQLTNTVIIKQVELVTVTNLVEAYAWTPKETTKEYAQGAGSISNLIAPGSGGAVAGILIGLAGAWAKLRSSKKTNVNLAQGIETIREFVKTVPNGAKYDAAIVQFLQGAQASDGVTKQVKSLVDNDVSNSEAKAQVGEIRSTLVAFAAPNVPGNPAGQV